MKIGNKTINIEIIKDNQISTERTDFYSIKVNGEIVMECMNAQEVKETTISDIITIIEDM